MTAPPPPTEDRYVISAQMELSSTDPARQLRALEQLLSLRATELGPAMQQAAQLVAEVLGAAKADVLLYDARARSLVALGTSDTPMGRAQHALGLDRLPLSEGGRAVRVYQTGEPYLCRRTEYDPAERPAIHRQLGVRSGMFAPFEVARERRGVVLACAARPGFFDEQDLLFLESVARWIGLVGQRAVGVEHLSYRAAEAGFRAAAEQLADALTPRQREVAALIATGKSNREIARDLVLVEGTVANHVEHILNRLGFRSRTQIAVWAAEHGLHRLATSVEDE